MILDEPAEHSPSGSASRGFQALSATSQDFMLEHDIPPQSRLAPVERPTEHHSQDEMQSVQYIGAKHH